MFWADRVAKELKQRKLPLEWVDDMKTPSGRIHVGALRGIVIHDLVYKALQKAGVTTKYTYVFDNHDPMDALPVYLPKEKFEPYLGMPLYKVPSPEEGFENYAEYYAEEFKKVFNTIGCCPEILWATDLYLNGSMNDGIKLCLDRADIIRGIYEELYKKELPKDWYPFQVYCPECGKVSTTKVFAWDGKEVSFKCTIEGLKWTKGCGMTGKVSPFSSKNGIVGKLPWKVEWAVKWKVIGITVEGAGKDHMSKGGSHDLASLVCERVLNYPVPYPIPYEWFLVGGRKMSTSKGVGSAASEMLDILPPELLRFLMVKTKINQQINFDPMGETIPKLFDEYQKAGQVYYSSSEGVLATESRSLKDNSSRQARTINLNDFNKDLARVFEYSQINENPVRPPSVRFSILAQWVQMPNMEEKIKEEGLQEWARYAKVWVEKYAPESEKFLVQKELPEEAKNLTEKQKEFLQKISSELEKKWDAEEFQKMLYEWAKELGISSKDAFAAIYVSLLGKDHGPKAGWLILSLDKSFVQKRFTDEINTSDNHYNDTYHYSTDNKIRILQKSELFSIDTAVKKKFPSVSVGVAVIKGVSIEKTNPELEKEKKKLAESFESLTTEHISQYPEVLSYRKLYKEMGIDWHSRRPSPEALLRRVALKKGLYTVNACVDAYNLVVMKHRVSIGAFDLDTLKMPTVLRFPKEGEEILLLGDNEPTKYTEKELAYFDQKGGFNIDFNYRDAQRTAVQMHTKNLYINVDGIYDITPQMVERSLKEACDMIMKYCGGTLEEFGVLPA